MKIIHDNGFSKAELAEYRPVVHENVLDLAQQMVRYMKDAGLDCVEGSNKVCHHPASLCRHPFHHFNLVDPSSLHSSLLSTLSALFSLHPQALAEKILECHLDSDSTSGPYFSPEIAEAIYQLSKDPIMLKIMEEHWTDLNLLNSAG
jgi:guanine nucleotide-binding protein subunit alpha